VVPREAIQAAFGGRSLALDRVINASILSGVNVTQFPEGGGGVPGGRKNYAMEVASAPKASTVKESTKMPESTIP